MCEKFRMSRFKRRGREVHGRALTKVSSYGENNCCDTETFMILIAIC
jgi:hypothetical protein